MKTLSQILTSGMLALTLFASPLAAQANPHYPTRMANHQRRDQVNRRFNRQNRRINQGLRNGTLSRRQAGQLHAEDRAMHNQEISDWRANGGYITRGQQHAINQQENTESHQIYSEKH